MVEFLGDFVGYGPVDDQLSTDGRYGCSFTSKPLKVREIGSNELSTVNPTATVTQESAVSGKGFGKILFFLIGLLMNKQGCEAARRELESLKKKLEGDAG